MLGGGLVACADVDGDGNGVVVAPEQPVNTSVKTINKLKIKKQLFLWQDCSIVYPFLYDISLIANIIPCSLMYVNYSPLVI